MRQRLIWLLIGLALVVVAISAVLAKLSVPAVISSAVAAVGAIVAGVSTTRAMALMKNGDDRWRTRQALLRCDRRGRLPWVRDLNDPIQLGVHPAAFVDSLGRVPAFVRRDVMPQLTSAILTDRFLLLVGESTAGKSRAAYEAMRELLPGHRLVEPGSRDATRTAVDAMLESPQAVLWLDDVERYLGAGGFTGAEVSSILSVRQHCIVATMRSEEYSYFCGGSSSMVDWTRSRETIRQGWDVLRLATRIDLARSWSSDEVRIARQIEPRDPRITEALEQVDRFGVAEYLAAGPQLLATWRDAWVPGMHPRGAALVLAAVDARRAGMHRPVSLEMLTRAHESYLRRHGGQRLRPEPIDSALEWATTPLHATSSLLVPSGDAGFIAFDYLIDAIERVAVPAEALEAFIDAGQPEELSDIGRAARYWDRFDQAELAFDRASATDAEGRKMRGWVIDDRDGQAAQELFLRQSVEALTDKLGWNHEHTITVRMSLAWDAGFGRSPRLALCSLLELKVDAETALGAFHPTTLNIRRGIAMWTGELGEMREAARLLLRVVEDCIDNLDENEWITYWSMFNYARFVGLSSTATQGIELLDEFEPWMRIRRAPANMLSVLRYERADQLYSANLYGEALDILESIVTDEEHARGRLNKQTLYARCRWLKCMAANGNPECALRLAQEVLNEYSTSLDSRHIVVDDLRLMISTMIGEAGDINEAVHILDGLKDERAEHFGEDDPDVHAIDYHLRYWAAIEWAHAGRFSDAAVELRRLSEDIAISNGLTWEMRETAELRDKALNKLADITVQHVDGHILRRA